MPFTDLRKIMMFKVVQQINPIVKPHTYEQKIGNIQTLPAQNHFPSIFLKNR